MICRICAIMQIMKPKDLIDEINNLEEELETIFSKYSLLVSVYLFGSTAQGFAKPISDIDIAVRVDERAPSDSYFDIRIKLMDELEGCFPRKVDIIILNSASLKMIHQVMISGRLIFTRDRKNELDYCIRKRKEYFDFKYYIDKDIKEMKAYFGESMDVEL